VAGSEEGGGRPTLTPVTVPPRSILHADMDAFFVSVELRRRPELVGRPVVVGGTGNRGVVAAASYEARRYGVHSALPSAIARRRCPHAVFLPGDHELYGRVSRQVHEIFERATPLVEPLSLDEAFLDVTGARRLLGDGETIARRLRDEICDELGLGCSVGVAPNKFLAKLASVEAKPIARHDRVDPGPGVFVVPPGGEQTYLDPLPVRRLWGVGPKTLEKLHRIGVGTVADVRRLDRRVLAGAVGTTLADHLAALAVGADDRPVEPAREAKSIGHEETHAHDIRTPSEMRTHLVRLADAVASRLRAARVGARTLTLKVRFSDGFHTITRSTTAREPIDQASDIVTLLGPIADAIDPTPGVRLVGVTGSNLAPVFHQLTFAEVGDDTPEHGAREAALDRIRARFGADVIGPASAVRQGRVRNVKRGAQSWGPDEIDPSSR
jgi:DNA polymerase-4